MVLSFSTPRLAGQDVREAGEYWRMGPLWDGSCAESSLQFLKRIEARGQGVPDLECSVYTQEILKLPLSDFCGEVSPAYGHCCRAFLLSVSSHSHISSKAKG